MTLNSSGPLSLGGSVVGQLINLELGLAAQATISLNDTSARTLAGIASGTISIGSFYGKSSIQSGLIITARIDSGDYPASGLAVDSSGNIFVLIAAYDVPSGTIFPLIAKFNSSGALEWQRRFGTTSFQAVGSCAVDSGGNVYITATASAAGAGGNDGFLVKYSPSGGLLWQRAIGRSANEFMTGVYVSGSFVYVTGSVNRYNSYFATTSDDAITAKFDTSGTIQWQRMISNTGTERGMKIFIDSSANVYTFMIAQTTALAKHNSAGIIQWAKLFPNSGNLTPLGLAVDSTGNIYISGSYYNPVGNDLYDSIIVKYSSSGVLQWQRRLYGGSYTYEYANAVACDPSGNVYCALSAFNAIVLIKFNPDGSQSWQRRFDASLPPVSPKEMTITSDWIYICGTARNANSYYNQTIVLRIPVSGGATGTYGTYQYTDSTSVLIQASSFAGGDYYYTSNIEVAGDATVTATGLTDSATSISSSVSSAFI